MDESWMGMAPETFINEPYTAVVDVGALVAFFVLLDCVGDYVRQKSKS